MLNYVEMYQSTQIGWNMSGCIDFIDLLRLYIRTHIDNYQQSIYVCKSTSASISKLLMSTI